MSMIATNMTQCGLFLIKSTRKRKYLTHSDRDFVFGELTVASRANDRTLFFNVVVVDSPEQGGLFVHMNNTDSALKWTNEDPL